MIRNKLIEVKFGNIDDINTNDIREIFSINFEDKPVIYKYNSFNNGKLFDKYFVDMLINDIKILARGSVYVDELLIDKI